MKKLSFLNIDFISVFINMKKAFYLFWAPPTSQYLTLLTVSWGVLRETFVALLSFQ